MIKFCYYARVICDIVPLRIEVENREVYRILHYKLRNIYAINFNMVVK